MFFSAYLVVQEYERAVIFRMGEKQKKTFSFIRFDTEIFFFQEGLGLAELEVWVIQFNVL